MKTDLKVSIVIPVYNGGQYLKWAIDSALSQTYEHVEIVVVNDGSTDDGHTRRVATEYGDRIQYFEKPNGGVASALNLGISKMSGDIFAWLSHDDIHLPEKTTRNVAYFQQIGRDDAILFSDYFLIDPDGKRLTEVKFNHSDFVRRPMLPLLNGCINGCSLFIPAHLLNKESAFDTELRFTQDYKLWNAMLRHHEFFHQPETLIEYRIHPNQDTQAQKPGVAIEGDALWATMLDDRTDMERAQLFGSSKRFFVSMAQFLENTPYQGAAAHARRRIDASSEALVSVVIPFYNELEEVKVAARSVLDQSHRNLELILVNDGSTEPLERLDDLISSDSRIRLLTQKNAGPGAARNHGLDWCKGEYVAFLDGDDTFLPHKIATQLAQMQEEGAQISHTSYLVKYPQRSSHLGTIRSGGFKGPVYPRILAGCPIATPTVMLHRSIISQGFRFPVDTSLGEDVLFWIALTMRYELLGIDEPLSIVEWSAGSAALNLQKSLEGVSFMIEKIKEDPLHSKHPSEIRALEDLGENFRVLIREATARSVTGPLLNEWLISNVFDGPGDLA